MASELPIRQSTTTTATTINQTVRHSKQGGSKVIQITDLDQSDNVPETDFGTEINVNNGGQELFQQQISANRRRQKYRNDLKNFSENFYGSGNRRSKSNDNVIMNKNSKRCDIDLNYYKIMIQTKDDHIEKLIGKITDLQFYNTRFSQENERLNNENFQLHEIVKNLNEKLEEVQNYECQLCKTLISEKNNLVEINKSLTNDICMLKTLVHRLNVQLERHQDKLRESQENQQQKTQQSQDLNEQNPRLVTTEQYSWGAVNDHTLAPLLNAYEETIKEKNYLLEQHEIELNRFTGQLKKIIGENTELHQKMDELRQVNDAWKDEKACIQAQLSVYRSKADIQTKRADIARDKLTEILKCYEQKVQSQTLDIERLQEAYSRSKEEIITLKNLQQQQPGGVFAENLKECQKLFEELKFQYNNERKNLSENLTELAKIKINLEERLCTIQGENKSLKDLHSKNQNLCENLKEKNAILKQTCRKLKESRSRLKLRLKNTLQWARRLEDDRRKVQNTWNDLKELETIVRHKEAQIKGLQARYLLEIGKLEEKLQQKDQTIKKILKEKISETQN